MILHSILAFIPFAVIIYFLIVKDKKASNVMMGTFFLTFGLLLLAWKVNIITLLAASGKGVLQALEIFLIIFSILLLFNLLKTKNKLDNLQHFMKSYTKDKVVLIILVGFFLVSFMEAIAGFGTPAAIAVPILVFLGIRPLTAVILALIADSCAVAFGAFGVPILFGIASVESANLTQVSITVGIINGVIAMILPTAMNYIYHGLEKKKLQEANKYLPLTLFAGISFGISYIMAAYLVSAEVVSVVASIIGFILTLIYLQFSKYVSKAKKNPMELLNSFAAYIVLVILLICSRINLFGFKDWLKSIGFNLNLIENIGFSLNLYSPGFLILGTFLLFAIIYKTNKKEFTSIVSTSVISGKAALITLIFTLAFVQSLIYSNVNSIGIESIPYLVAEVFSHTGVFYIFLAPIIGVFGAFITGSATVSNLIFSSLQANVSAMTIYPQELLLSLQAVGASAGNMIAIHNVIAACSLVGLKNYESQIIKTNVKVAVSYCLIASIIGIIIYMF